MSYGCNKQCFTLYCCLSGPTFPPLFPWSSNAMCCNLIMYILSLVHQRERERGTKESDDSPTLVVRTLTVHGNCSWNEGKLLLAFLRSDDDRPTLRGGSRKLAPQHPRVLGSSTRRAENPYRRGNESFRGHQFWPIFRNFQPL